MTAHVHAYTVLARKVTPTEPDRFVCVCGAPRPDVLDTSALGPDAVAEGAGNAMDAERLARAARRIIAGLDAAGDRVRHLFDDGPRDPQAEHDRASITTRYAALRGTTDFTTASRIAREEFVVRVLEEAFAPAALVSRAISSAHGT